MRKFLLLLLLIYSPFRLLADEGMWLLTLLDKLTMDKMNSMGLNLTSEDIYSINNGSLKDAVAIFGGGCTCEMVSEQGLMLTNYHCAHQYIQELSSVENDYLTEGFWASSKEEEMPVEGLSVTFMVSMEDITQRVLDSLSDTLSFEERANRLDLVKKSIARKATEDNDYEGLVEKFYRGNKFFLVLYEEYNDVRLVGVPPSFIGEFGDETDNWMWPRHTGDFAVFRVYCGPDGEPAAYSEKNKPYTPKHFLPVSKAGVEENDFTMVIGFPGSTNRYITSYEIKELRDIEHPNRIKIRGKKQDIMKKFMSANDTIRIKYANKYARSSNYWKYSVGQLKCIEDYNLENKPIPLENDFERWANLSKERNDKYGDVIATIKTNIDKRKPLKHSFQYYNEAIFRSSEIFNLAIRTTLLYQALKLTPKDTFRINTLVKHIKEIGKEHFDNYVPKVDKAVTLAMLKMFHNDVESQYQPKILFNIQEKYEPGLIGNLFSSSCNKKQPIERYVDKLYKKSLFSNSKKFYKFMDDPDYSELGNDMAFQMALSIREQYIALMPIKQSYDNNIEKARKLFMEGIMKMYKDSAIYPDANFTMRLSYGKVKGYEPRDAVYYDHFTSLSGVMEKKDPEAREFNVPDKLEKLFRNKDFGSYNEQTYMPVSFIADNDITGGNSGSPVINGDGELIGIAFDGNWEAMGSDIVFNDDYQRAICVDIRYVLFIIDKFAGQGYLLDELKIVN